MEGTPHIFTSTKLIEGAAKGRALTQRCIMGQMMESTPHTHTHTRIEKKMVKAISVGAQHTYYFSEPSVSSMEKWPKIMVLSWITSET